MHKLYRTPKEHLASPLWALNNSMDLNADIRPVRLVRKQKAPNYSENDLVHFFLRTVCRALWDKRIVMIKGCPC